MFSTRVVPADAATAGDVLNYLPKVFEVLRHVEDLDTSEEKVIIEVLKGVEGVIPRPHFHIVADIVRALIAGLDLGPQTRPVETIEVLPSVEATPTEKETSDHTSEEKPEPNGGQTS